MGFLGTFLSKVGVNLTEASTWRGIVLILTALGTQLTPEQTNAIIGAGIAVAGLIGVFFVDNAQDP